MPHLHLTRSISFLLKQQLLVPYNNTLPIQRTGDYRNRTTTMQCSFIAIPMWKCKKCSVSSRVNIEKYFLISVLFCMSIRRLIFIVWFCMLLKQDVLISLNFYSAFYFGRLEANHSLVVVIFFFVV